MRVFISYARDNAESAEQLAEALRRHNIETRSSRDLASGEDWRRVADEEGAKADALLFLLRTGDSADQLLQAEWHPDETIDPVRYAEGLADMARRREELKEYALALKEPVARAGL